MGVTSSSFRKAKGDEPGGEGGVDVDNEIWITVKAKTTDKRTREVKKKKIQFLATTTGKAIGSAATCDLTVDDSNVSAIHARVGLGEDGNAYIHTTGRTYFLIGQGVKNTGPHKLEKDQVVKMGACSLQVTDTCIVSRLPDDTTPEPQLPQGTGAEDPEACYICFDASSETGRELMPSPCTCKKPVHRSCLSKWIATKGSRLCSICKGKLPIDFTVDPPFVVLQVVRHMRGLHWAGEREYIISFSQRSANFVTVGSGMDCDLSLPDPSLSRTHSRITHRDGAFYVEDMTSSAGTFLKLTGVHLLPADTASIFKLGRTMLTIKVEKRKIGGASASGLSVLRSWRARHKKLPLSPASAAVALAHGIVLEEDGTIRAPEGVDAEELERRLAVALNMPNNTTGEGGVVLDTSGVVDDSKLGEDGEGDEGELDAEVLGAVPVGTPRRVVTAVTADGVAGEEGGSGGGGEEVEDVEDAQMTPLASRLRTGPPPAVIRAGNSPLLRTTGSVGGGGVGTSPVTRVQDLPDDNDDEDDADFQAQLAAATAASLAEEQARQARQQQQAGGDGVTATTTQPQSSNTEDSKMGDAEDVDVD